MIIGPSAMLCPISPTLGQGAGMLRSGLAASWLFPPCQGQLVQGCLQIQLPWLPVFCDGLASGAAGHGSLQQSLFVMVGKSPSCGTRAFCTSPTGQG